MHTITFFFKKESVIIGYNKQYICFHSYAMKEKHQFRRFAQALEETKPQDISEIYGMARESNVRAQASRNPIASKVIY